MELLNRKPDDTGVACKMSQSIKRKARLNRTEYLGKLQNR